MADGGIRGIRFTLFDPATSVTSFEMIEPLAKQVNDLGWHVQLHLRGDQIVEHEEMLKRIVSPIVFDHMGRIPQPQGIKHPAFGIILRLIDKGKTWVKLSGVYQDTKVGPPTLRGPDRGRPRLPEGGAGADGLGERLAAPDRERQAQRRRALRSDCRVGAR